MRTYIKLVTSQLAEKWIDEANAKNPRKVISWANVERIAKAMEMGRWVLTHQGIAFDKYGNLVDGQHRLLAIIQTGISCTMLITEGVDCEAIPEMDQGQKRNNSTMLQVDSRHADTIAFLARIIFNLKASRYDLERVRDIVISDSEKLIQVCGSTRKGLTTSVVKSAFLYYKQKYNSGPIDHTFTQYRDFVLLDLSRIETVTRVSPALRSVHQRLTGQSAANQSKKALQITAYQTFAYVLTALKFPAKTTVNGANLELCTAECREFYKNILGDK